VGTKPEGSGAEDYNGVVARRASRLSGGSCVKVKGGMVGKLGGSYKVHVAMEQ